MPSQERVTPRPENHEAERMLNEAEQRQAAEEERRASEVREEAGEITEEARKHEEAIQSVLDEFDEEVLAGFVVDALSYHQKGGE